MQKITIFQWVNHGQSTLSMAVFDRHVKLPKGRSVNHDSWKNRDHNTESGKLWKIANVIANEFMCHEDNYHDDNCLISMVSVITQ